MRRDADGPTSNRAICSRHLPRSRSSCSSAVQTAVPYRNPTFIHTRNRKERDLHSRYIVVCRPLVTRRH
ncbi:hypothetical protein BD414DRAFT_290458 [Trametes punicea]|nr:hypothetical protein BD414DRAFT_290458 [Trametes punicea]